MVTKTIAASTVAMAALIIATQTGSKTWAATRFMGRLSAKMATPIRPMAMPREGRVPGVAGVDGGGRSFIAER